MELPQKKEQIKVLNLLKVFHGVNLYEKDLYTRDAKCALEADPEFRKLEKEKSARLLDKCEPCVRGQQAIAVAAGISASKFDADYKLLSSLSHPTGFGVRVMDAATLADNEWQIWFAQIVWIAQIYLELAVAGVCEQQMERRWPKK